MDSSFWQSAYAGAGAASAEYNLDLVCEGPDGDGEEDYEAQNEMIDRAIREQVDALLPLILKRMRKQSTVRQRQESELWLWTVR